MWRWARGLAVIALGAAPALAAGLPGCGTDAVGVDACRQIESVRCELAPACAAYAKASLSGDGLPVVESPNDVTRCQEFYRDQCLNGIENASDPAHIPSKRGTEACIAALRAAAGCATAPAIAGCQGADVSAPDDASLAPCQVILYQPEVLAACAFVVAPPDAGEPGVDASDGGSEASDAAGE